ncbi:MAG: hypothetical protein NWE89_15655 [Candidatus Bathyarchaeota archaeon]|nr:hypothetical protein [Candidatus Bathyarchaeota archaeon]
MDKLKVGKLLGFLSLIFLSGFVSIFYLDLLNPFVFIYLKIIAVGVIPSVICFSWLYFWRDFEDPFRYLSLWNCGTQVLFLGVNLFRVQVKAWGVLGVLYLLLSVVLLGFYLTDIHMTKWGFFTLSGLILLNVVLAFAVTLTTFDYLHPVFAYSSNNRILTVGSFVTELSVMGALFTSSSQLYWHDILTRRREQAMVEAIFASL